MHVSNGDTAQTASLAAVWALPGMLTNKHEYKAQHHPVGSDAKDTSADEWGSAMVPGLIAHLVRSSYVFAKPKSGIRSVITAPSPPSEIASIHHLACTGGTIISKCIAAMQDVYFLSELHPFKASVPQFAPMAVVAQFQAQYYALSAAEMKAAFLAQVEIVALSAKRQRRHLVLRDHAHTDFCDRGGTLSPTILATLAEAGYRTHAVATIRCPVESYISMLNNRWKNLKFDEYCDRWLAFLNCYNDRPIYRYEDFCNDPEGVIVRICNDLHIPFDSEFRRRIPDQNLTGDSGRSSHDIGVRAAKPISPGLLQDIGRSQAYSRILRGWPAYERGLQ